MKKISEPIIFFGSGPVAAASLQLLHKSFNIEAVITKPRPPHHRGAVPVLELSQKLHITTHTASNKQELDELFQTASFKSRLGILIDFGIIVSQKVIDYFPLGIVNSHFSILPEWRGADPISFAVLSGQKQTGVSIMLLTAGLDEGPLLGYGEYNMPSDITTPKLTDHLIELSYRLLEHDIPLYLSGKTHGVPQEITGRQVSYSKKLTKENGVIDWTKSADQIEREIRAFVDWPKSRTQLGNIELVITQAHVLETHGQPGKPAIIEKQLVVHCGQKSLSIDRLKPSGKQEMTGQAFLAGYKDKII